MIRLLQHVLWSVWPLLLVCVPALTMPAAAQNRALVIGLGAYGDAKLASPHAVSSAADIAAIETLLTGTLGYAQDEIKVLRDAQATKAAILDGITDWLRPDRKEIEEAAKEAEAAKQGKKTTKAKKRKKKKKAKAKPRRSFLYFAGYGHFQRDLDGDEADGFDEALVPYDAVVGADSGGNSITGLLTDDEFSAALKTLEGRRVTVVLDTSHSGQVTRLPVAEVKPAAAARVPPVAGAIRNIKDDHAVALRKNERGFVETSFAKGTLTVWSAVSASQMALLHTGGAQPAGLFTQLFVDGHQAAPADRNGNKVLSNTELLEYLKRQSHQYCAARRERCEMGLTPRLDPARAHRGVALRKTKKRFRKLTLGKLTDYLVNEGSDQVVIEQIPPSPVRVGAENIRYRVTPKRDGRLVLLNLTEAGQLVQLYPNQFISGDAAARAGRVSANAPLDVPDADYRLQLTATDPGKGHIIAILAPDRIDFGANVTARSIGDIPRSEAVRVYLPQLAAALTSPLHTANADTDTVAATWSVTMYKYEILP